MSGNKTFFCDIFNEYIKKVDNKNTYPNNLYFYYVENIFEESQKHQTILSINVME